MSKELTMSDIYSSYLDDIERLQKENKKLMTKCRQLEKELGIYKRAIERTDRIEKCLNQEGQIKNLQEQLKEANAIITGEVHLVKKKDDEYICECPEIVNYKKKWGVK